MTQERALLVDFENVQQLDLSRLPADFTVTIFVGCAQKCIPLGLVQQAQKLGERVAWCQVDGVGTNALDFHIAYYLGCGFARDRKAQYYILSKDTGFDPLVRHLAAQGLCCERIGSLAELTAPTVPKPSLPTPQAPHPPLKLALVKPTPKIVHAAPVVPAPKPLPAPKPVADLNYDKVVAALAKNVKNRPTKRETLTNHVAALWQKRLSSVEVERLVARLFRDGKVSEANNALTYQLPGS